MPKFTIKNRLTDKEETREIDQDAMLIGRLKTCGIHLDSKSVSRKHAEIVRINQNYFLMDLESGNGTFLNNRKLKPNEKNVLHPGDTLRIEEFEVQIFFTAKTESEPLDENTDSGIIEIKMIKKVLAAIDPENCPSLEGLNSPVEGHRVTITEDMEEIIIGRDRECAFCIPAEVVSRKHAALKKKWGGWTLADLKSKNLTLINDKVVDEQVIKDGDIITIGNIKVMFRNPQEIDIASLARNYEEKEKEKQQEQEDEQIKEAAEVATKSPEPLAEKKSEPQKKPKPAKISDEAKISLGQDTKKPLPPESSKPTTPIQAMESKPLQTDEIILLGLGVFILLLALFGLYWFLH